MDDTGKRLGEFLRYKKVRPTQVERDCGISNGLVGKAIKKQTHLSSDKLEKILSVFPDLSAEWLLRGIGPMILGEGGEFELANDRLTTLQERVDILERWVNWMKEVEEKDRK